MFVQGYGLKGPSVSRRVQLLSDDGECRFRASLG